MSGDTSARIRRFIGEEILLDGDGDGASLNDQTPLLRGLIDSLGLMQLVGFLEEEFGITIDDTEVVPDHFRTVSAIGRLVETKGAE